MISLGLKRSEYKEYLALLKSNHCLHVRVQMLNLSHGYIGDISNRLMDGQVNIDADAEITRSLEVDFFDPNGSLRIAPEDPDEGAVYMDRMVRVIYCIAPPDKSKWFEVPVFCGPITKVNRDDVIVKIEAQGKETLAQNDVWKTHTYKKGLTKSTVIRRILVQMAGERKLTIADSSSRLPRNLSVGANTSPWKSARRLASGLSMQLFYDGRGVARLRKRPTRRLFTFDESNILTKPQISYDASNAKNAILVIGAKPKGSKKRIRVRRVAPRAHPLSPWSIGRKNADGDFVPRYLPLVIEDSGIRSKKHAKSVAAKRLRSELIEAVEATFDCLPAPHLEPLDVFHIQTSEFASDARLRKMTIPLTADGVGSIGVLKRTTPRRKHFRTRRR